MTMATPARPTKFCQACGAPIDSMAEICPKCGVRQAGGLPTDASEKRILPAALLCFFFGALGVHRFYVGKIGTGIAQLFTLGGLGVWAAVDVIMIVVGAFRDKDGRKLVQWT